MLPFPKTKEEAEYVAEHYRRVIDQFRVQCKPGSIVETVGIPRYERELERVKEFLAECEQ